MIQSVLFDKKFYTLKQAKNKLKSMNLTAIKLPHIYFRFRIKDPNIFKNFVTKKINANIILVLGLK
jgi:hypothetical protein